MSILPPNATPLDRALDQVELDGLGELPIPIRSVWNPQTCPAQLLP